MSKVFEYITSLFGQQAASQYQNFIESDPAQYIRVNTLKTGSSRISQLLKDDYNITTAPVPGIPNALKIIASDESQPDAVVSKTIEHIAGLYYIQGLSSQLPPLVLNPSSDDTVLDLCSAPGSKTTSLAEMMNSAGTLIANEVQLDRVKMLVHNLERMNVLNAAVLHSKGELISKLYSNHFTKVLVDAPCSGLGIIQKKGEVNLWWNLEKARNLGDLQTRLLVSAVKAAAPGGEIVYSTCTLTVEENEFVVNTILKNYPVEIMDVNLPVPSHPAFTSYDNIKLHPDIGKARRILPWEADSDGFFIVRLRKTAATPEHEPVSSRGRDINFVGHEHKDVRHLLASLISDFGFAPDIFSRYKYRLNNGEISFVNAGWSDPNPGVFQRIGTKFGMEGKRGSAVLYTEAAQILQNDITKNIYTIEDQDDLKRYMEGGIIKKDAGFSGQCAIKYKDFILGTAVVTGSGIKSRFPRSKRTQAINY